MLNATLEPEALIRILRIHDLSNGVLVCHPVPPGRTDGDLSCDLLHALGKRPRAEGWSARPQAARGLAGLWLQAEQVSDAVLVRADLFSREALHNFVTLVHTAKGRPWLVFDTTQRWRTAQSALGVEATKSLTIARPRRRAGSRRDDTPSPFESDASPLLARAAAAHRLPPRDFQQIDARMQSAFTATSTWLASTRRLDQRTIESFLAAVTSGSRVYRHARLIGAYSAMLQHGLAADLANPSQAMPATLAAPSIRQAEEIRRDTDPAVAALNALGLLTSLDRTVLSGLTLDQVNTTAPTVEFAGYTFGGAAAAALRAQVANQAELGAAPTDPLFTVRQLRRYRGPVAEGPRAAAGTLVAKLAPLNRTFDITMSQPALDRELHPPSRPSRADAALALRCLQLKPSRELSYSKLAPHERAAARRLTAMGAVSMRDGSIFATQHLYFSHFLADTTRYLVEQGTAREWHRRAFVV